jgi:broad-specificity NMP kinase
MFDVCPHCGLYDEAKIVEGSTAICPHCQHRIRFIKLPLYVVTGASGTGKTTLSLKLPYELPGCICLETDILWSETYNMPDDDYRLFRNSWLRLAKNIAQNNIPAMLCGSVTPGQFENCPQGRYFSSINYLVLVCDDDVLAERLRARPAWRGSSSDEFVSGMQGFNRWFKENAEHADYDMQLLDTTQISTAEAVSEVIRWFQQRASLSRREE